MDDIKRKEYNKIYSISEKGKISALKYRLSEKGKISRKRAAIKFYSTIEGKKKRSDYFKSEKGIEAKKRHRYSDKWKETSSSYMKSEKGRKTMSKYLATEKGRYLYRKLTLKKYGLTVELYNKILAKQDNKCAVKGCNYVSRDKNLCVDHDHETGKVRGLLCHRHNSAIGFFGDNAEGVIKAYNYLTNPLVIVDGDNSVDNYCI